MNPATEAAVGPARNSPWIIPLFLPHAGCRHRCVFCDQQAVTGLRQQSMDAGMVRRQIESWLAERPCPEAPAGATAENVPRSRPSATAFSKKCGRHNRRVELAFYGGTFTALPPARQQELLDAVRPWLLRGEIDAVRLSTRPDALDDAICGLLRRGGVQVVELGVQSMDDRVLAASHRGHDADRSERAILLLRRHGFTVGIHLMVGLPEETWAGVVRGARRLAGLRPDFVRIHPTLVMAGSGLAALYRQGRYRPLSLPVAVARVARLRQLFDAAGIAVVRAGLQDTESLRQHLLAGPFHPAFGELVASRLLFNRVRRLLATGSGPRVLRVAARDESVFRGHKNSCLQRLAALGLLAGVTVRFRDTQERGTLRLRQQQD